MLRNSLIKRMNFIHKKQNSRKNTGARFLSGGFTLIEAFVAIAILMFTIVGPLTLAQRSLSAAYYAKDQVTAYYLAEEAVEYIRNLRDENRLNNNPWLQGAETCFSFSGGSTFCGVDPWASSGSSIVLCTTNNNNCLLAYNPSSSVYGHAYFSSGMPMSGWQNSLFSRKVLITKPDGSLATGAEDEVVINVEVSWQTESLSAQSFKLTENIFDW